MSLNIKGFFPLDHPSLSPDIEQKPPSLFTGQDHFDDQKEARDNRAKDHNLVYASPKSKIDIISSG